jgi:hypothetical protein
VTVYLSARYRLGELALYALGAALFVALGLFFLTVKAPEPGSTNWVAFTVGVVTALVFGFLLIAAVVRILDRRQILVIDDEGIRDLRLGPHVIPWTEIHGILEYPVNPEAFFLAQAYFAIEVDNPRRFVSTSFLRSLLQANRIFGFPGLNIGSQGLDVSRNALRAALGSAPGAAGKLQQVQSISFPLP